MFLRDNDVYSAENYVFIGEELEYNFYDMDRVTTKTMDVTYYYNMPAS